MEVCSGVNTNRGKNIRMQENKTGWVDVLIVLTTVKVWL